MSIILKLRNVCPKGIIILLCFSNPLPLYHLCLCDSAYIKVDKTKYAFSICMFFRSGSFWQSKEEIKSPDVDLIDALPCLKGSNKCVSMWGVRRERGFGQLFWKCPDRKCVLAHRGCR